MATSKYLSLFPKSNFSILSQIKTKIHKLFSGEVNPLDSNRCEICVSLLSDEEEHFSLSEEEVGVILKSFLIRKSTNEIKRPLTLCPECFESFTEMVDLFVNLDALKCQFNTIRRTLVQKVICGTLQRSDREWILWGNELKLAEEIYWPGYGIKEPIKTKTVGVSTNQIECRDAETQYDEIYRVICEVNN